MSAKGGLNGMSAKGGPSGMSAKGEAAWQNPWFMAAFFCAAVAVGLLWQSAQIDADVQMMIEQLRANASS